MDNIYVYVVDLPFGVGEAVMKCADGYTIYLSARLDAEAQRKCYDHAIRHIMRDDWSKTNVQEIETECGYG